MKKRKLISTLMVAGLILAAVAAQSFGSKAEEAPAPAESTVGGVESTVPEAEATGEATAEEAATLETSETSEAAPLAVTAETVSTEGDPASPEPAVDTAASSETEFVREGRIDKWEEADFEIEGKTVKGFSNKGLQKAKVMLDEDELNFPEGVTNIAQNAFIYSKYKDELLNGIVGKVKFHKNITSIGNSAFQGNPEINEVIIEDGESIFFGGDAFNPARKVIGVDYQNYDGNVAVLEDVERSKLTSLVIGKRKFNAYGRAFAKSSIKSIDFSNATGNGFTINDKGEKKYSSIADIEQLVFFDSAIEEIVSFGKIGYINYGAFANCELKKVNITKDLYTIGHKAFMNNANLTELTFDERTADDPGVEIRGDAFFGTNISGTVAFPNNVQVTVWGGDNSGRNPGFKGNKITKLVHSDQGGVLGWNTFEFNPIETIENLYPRHYFESSLFANSEALKNVSFVSFDKYVDKRITGIPNNAFGNGKLKSVEIPEHFTSIAGNAYQNNLGWAEGESKVAVYRKNEAGYVTDNAVADGDSFVINPALVTIEVTNQYGGTYDKEVLLKGTRKRTLSSGADDKADVTVNTVGNFADFKLGDSYTFTLETPGITLKSIDGADVAEGVTEHTVNVTGTTEVPYGDGYKLGYQKKVITLVVNDPNAVNPLLYLYIPDPELPVTPSNQNDVPPVTPVTPASEEKPTVVEDLTIDGDETPQGSKEIEEDLDVESDEIPQGSKEIKKLGKKEKVEEMVEDLDIEGDEIPQGDTELGGERGKKTSKVQALLAKTGGQNVMIFQVVAVFAVLVLGYAVLSFFAARKKER